MLVLARGEVVVIFVSWNLRLGVEVSDEDLEDSG